MTFLPMTQPDDLGPEGRAALASHLEVHGGALTNMKATLLSHVPSFTAYMEAHTLRDALVPYIGERAVSLFCYAISEEYGGPIPSAFFRKVLVDAGDDPDNPQVTETEQLLIDWGRLIARDPHGVPDEMYARLETTFNPKLRTLLVAFAGLMVAVNLFTTVGRIPVDEALA